VSKKTIRTVLRNFGLTQKEAEIYIFLAKHGVLSGGEISKRTKTHRGLIYRILKSLQKKGVVESTLESPVRFSSVSFEKILDDNIKAKQQEAVLLEKAKDSLLNDWENISKTKKESNIGKFMIIEGNRKIYLKISQMINETKNQMLMISSVRGLCRSEQYGIFERTHNHQAKSKTKFRFLTELSNKNTNAMKILRPKLKTEVNLRVTNSDSAFTLLPRMVIRDEDEALFFISPETDVINIGQAEICFCTNNVSFVKTLVGIFEELWRYSTDVDKKIFEIEMGELPTIPDLISNAEKAMNEWLTSKTIQYYLQVLELMKNQNEWQNEQSKILNTLGGLYGLISEHEKANECYLKGIACTDDNLVKDRMQRKIQRKMIVENDGVKLAYYMYGKGKKTLIFLAWTGTDRLWTHQVTYFSKKYKVVTMDLRGTGKSDKPPGEYTVDLFTNDLKAIIENLPDEEIIFVGLYVGGTVGIKYVTKYPGRISKLVLVSMGPKQIRSDDYPYAQIDPERIKMFYSKALKSPSWGVKKLSEMFFPKPEYKHFRERYVNFPTTPPAIVINAFINYNKEDVRPLLKKITIPTLVLSYPRMSEIMKDMDSRIPKSKYYEFKTPIFPNLFEASKFNRILENFINDEVT